MITGIVILSVLADSKLCILAREARDDWGVSALLFIHATLMIKMMHIMFK